MMHDRISALPHTTERFLLLSTSLATRRVLYPLYYPDDLSPFGTSKCIGSMIQRAHFDRSLYPMQSTVNIYISLRARIHDLHITLSL